MSDKKKEFWPWGKKDPSFTVEQVEDLLRRVKVFNAGCIDDYLSTHVDKVYEAWKSEISES